MHLRIALLALLTASLPLTACLPTEVTCANGACDGEGGNDAASTTATTGTGGNQHGQGGGPTVISDGGGPDAYPSTALAYRYADLPAVGGDSGSSTASGGEPAIDPDMLVVFVSDQAMACANPWGPLACGLHWSVSIDIPVALQKPGTYSIAVQADDTHVSAMVSSTGEGQGEDCGFGGGTAMNGTVEVTSVDATSVVGHLHTGTFDPALGDLDVDFVAPRCP